MQKSGRFSKSAGFLHDNYNILNIRLLHLRWIAVKFYIFNIKLMLKIS